MSSELPVKMNIYFVGSTLSSARLPCPLLAGLMTSSILGSIQGAELRVRGPYGPSTWLLSNLLLYILYLTVVEAT